MVQFNTRFKINFVRKKSLREIPCDILLELIFLILMTHSSVNIYGILEDTDTNSKQFGIMQF
jgi:hypothetical protein